MTDTVQARVREIIRKEIVSGGTHLLTSETRLREDLGADSLDIIELIMVLEKEFEIDIPDDDLAKFTTVAACEDIVAELLRAR